MAAREKPVLLIVDDDRSTRDGLQRALGRNYDTRVAESAERALTILAEQTVDIMLSDIRMPGMDGLSLLQRALAQSPQPACVLMTAYGSIDKAVEAIRRGASDYITKPYNLDDLEMRLDRALRSRSMQFENQRLHAQLDDRYGLENIVGSSESMQQVIDMIRQVAPTQATVLLLGESGTGKELVAHAIHQLSSRGNGPFVAVHCAALSQSLMESELFGHEKGAFTGAHERRVGRFELADGGSLFLDELSEIDSATQTKLLRVLEERRFERVGGTKTIDVDIRLIAATNKNLKDLVAENVFRSDLYFRMNVASIELPPLREHSGDIPALCRRFLDEFNAKNNKSVQSISGEAMELLTAYSWPGNVRELRNAIERMIVFAKDAALSPQDVPNDIRAAVSDSANRQAWGLPNVSTPKSMKEAEKMMILSALEKNNGNRTRAALQLGISRRTFHRKLKEYNISGS